MAKHTLKIFSCEHCKIFIVRLAIFQYYGWYGWLESYSCNFEKSSNYNAIKNIYQVKYVAKYTLITDKYHISDKIL